MPRVARIRVPIYQETGKHTLYRIEVTTDDGRTRKVERATETLLRFHGTPCRAAPHPKLEQFDFPHKSILNTNAEFTKEREGDRGSRGRGVDARFALLLSLGPNYAPFVETFLKADERALDDSGHSRPATPTPVAQRPAVVFDDDEDDDDSTIAIQQPSFVLEKPRSLTHWALCFYLPVALVTYAHCCVLTLLGASTEDWSKGQAWLAVLSAPLVLCVAFALLAPAVDDAEEP